MDFRLPHKCKTLLRFLFFVSTFHLLSQDSNKGHTLKQADTSLKSQCASISHSPLLSMQFICWGHWNTYSWEFPTIWILLMASQWNLLTCSSASIFPLEDQNQGFAFFFSLGFWQYYFKFKYNVSARIFVDVLFNQAEEAPFYFYS